MQRKSDKNLDDSPQMRLALVLFAALSLCGCDRTILQEEALKPFTSHGQPAQHCSKVQIWLVQPAGEELHLVGVDRPINLNKQPVSEVVESLLHGPVEGEKDSGLASEIPLGTILLGVHENAPDELELDLSKRFTAGGEGTSLETRIEQLRRTIDPVTQGKKVFLDVEGKRLASTMGEGLEVKQPINQ